MHLFFPSLILNRNKTTFFLSAYYSNNHSTFFQFILDPSIQHYIFLFRQSSNLLKHLLTLISILIFGKEVLEISKLFDSQGEWRVFCYIFGINICIELALLVSFTVNGQRQMLCIVVKSQPLISSQV